MSRWRKLLGRIEPAEEDEDSQAALEAVSGARISDTRTPASPEQLHHLLDHLSQPLSDGVDTLTLVRDELGPLRSRSGRIVVCDPFQPHGEVPTVEAQSGHVSVVRRVTDAGPRIAMAILRLADEQPVNWQPCGEYAVGSGTSCFADPEALELLSARSAAFYAQPGPLVGEEPLVDALHARDAVLYEVDADHHLAAFTSGLGDGVYAAWLGLASNGTPCVVLSSFDNIAAETAP